MEEEGGFNDEEKNELTPPEDVGEQIASLLLGEIEQGGVVDSTHQVCILIFCTLSTIVIIHILLHSSRWIIYL